MNKLDEIKERHSKATPGPYRWDIRTCHKQAYLTTTHSGQYYVMGFKRWGMHGAQPEFQVYDKYEGPVRERGSNGMVATQELAKPRAKHHPDFDMWIDHPDAIAIENSWEDIDFLLSVNADMYEALEEIMARCELRKDEDDAHYENYYQAKQVLAKAKGESHE
jgi:hypothetical protein